MGQAIGKLLENKSKSNISVQKMEKSKKSSPNKSEQDLGNNKNKKLVKSKSSNFDSDVDADVEDELSESDLAVISKPKLVRKSASLSLTSPEKGTNFPYFLYFEATLNRNRCLNLLICPQKKVQIP